MITPDGCRIRRERLWQAMPEPMDAVLCGEPCLLAHLAGFYPSPFLFRSQNAPAILALLPDGDSILFVDNLQQAAAHDAFAGQVAAVEWYRGRASAEVRTDRLFGFVGERLREWRLATLGIDGGVPAVLAGRIAADHPGLRTLDIGGIAHALMRRKCGDEVAALRESGRCAAAAVSAAMAGVQPGMTELEAFDLVRSAVTTAAGEPREVYGDFASGPRAAQGGGECTGRHIEAGELFLLDFSVIVRGYRVDIAQTWCVGGKPSAAQRRMEVACRTALERGAAMLRPGAVCRQIDAAVRGILDGAGLGGVSPGHLGHGIGLGHPEPPYIVTESADTLEEGDVVTLEPGLYIAGVGGMRFERNYLVTGDGPACLTPHFVGLELNS